MSAVDGTKFLYSACGVYVCGSEEHEQTIYACYMPLQYVYVSAACARRVVVEERGEEISTAARRTERGRCQTYIAPGKQQRGVKNGAFAGNRRGRQRSVDAEENSAYVKIDISDSSESLALRLNRQAIRRRA